MAHMVSSWQVVLWWEPWWPGQGCVVCYTGDTTEGRWHLGWNRCVMFSCSSECRVWGQLWAHRWGEWSGHDGNLFSPKAPGWSSLACTLSQATPPTWASFPYFPIIDLLPKLQSYLIPFCFPTELLEIVMNSSGWCSGRKLINKFTAIY